MAKGHETHQQRQAQVSALGKDLARRAKSKCELCEAAGEKLNIHEVTPLTVVPDLNRCLLLCSSCFEQVSEPRRFKAGQHWRCLAKVVWSELPVIQVVAVRLLKRQQDSQAWAADTLQQVYLASEVEEWADQEQ